jgi:hypothetical protein
MNTYSSRTSNTTNPFSRFQLRRPVVFGALIVTALIAFELFNYSTNDYALGDLLGNLKFLGIRWATILAIAFCGIDFAGIARLFTPEMGADEPKEVWYLFGAWLIGASMNALLTWWGVSLAILNHDTLGNAVVSRQTLLKVVPIFVAIMVWLIRVLIIGTFSVAGDRLFGKQDPLEKRSNSYAGFRALTNRPATSRFSPSTTPSTYRPSPKPAMQTENNFTRPEPTYSPVSMSGKTQGNSQLRR